MKRFIGILECLLFVVGDEGLTIEQLEETWNFKTGNMEGIRIPSSARKKLPQ